MGNIAVGIDTSKDKGRHSKGRRLICAVVGSPEAINRFVSSIESTARLNGYTGNIHWKHIKAPLRERILAEHHNALETLGLRAIIFLATRGEKSRRNYYLKECSSAIAADIGSLINERTDSITVVPDTDFDALVPSPSLSSQCPSNIFLSELLSNLSFAVLGAYIAPIRKKHGASLSAYRKNGRRIKLSGSIGSQSSPEVQAADVLLGMYKLARSKNQRLNRVALREIK